MDFDDILGLVWMGNLCMGSGLLSGTVRRGLFEGNHLAEGSPFLVIVLFRCRERHLHIASLQC